MHSLRIWLWAVVVVFSVSIGHAQEEYRTWTSKNGAHKLEAEFVKEDNGIVFLKKREGETIEVKLSGLSKADNDFVKKLRSDPFGWVEKTPRVDDAPTKTIPRHSNGKELNLVLDEVWNVQPDPFVSTVQVDKNLIDLNMKHVMGSMALSPDRSTMYAFYRETAAKPVVQKIDLVTGDLIGTAHQIPESYGLDVTPDNQVFMATSKGRFRQQFLNIVRYGETLNPIASFQPYGDKGKVVYARFVDNDHFLTVSSEGLLGLWNIKSLKLRWSVQVSGKPTLSPNRKLLFLHVNATHLAVLDALTGEVMGMRPAALKGVSQLCVNDSCTKLVGVGMGACRLWDLATGDLVADFSISGTLRDCHALFVNDDQILVSQMGSFMNYKPSSLYDLVDLNLQCSMWAYGFTTPPVAGLDGKVWMAPKKAIDDPAPELACTQIPHSEAADAINSTSFEQVSRIEPGARLPMKINYNAPNWNKANIEENARQFVGSYGYELALEESDPGFEVNLDRPEQVNDRGIHFVEDMGRVAVLFIWQGQAVWRAERTKEFYQQDPHNKVSIFDNPWMGWEMPKTFRFYKPVLDGSRPVANGNGPPNFEPLTFYRSYDKGFAWGTGVNKGQTPPKAPRPPGMRGGVPRIGR